MDSPRPRLGSCRLRSTPGTSAECVRGLELELCSYPGEPRDAVGSERNLCGQRQIAKGVFGLRRMRRYPASNLELYKVMRQASLCNYIVNC
jgi:hypothetical protein